MPDTLAGTSRERALALRRGLLADLDERDKLGRIRLRHGASLAAGDHLYVCAEDGRPELEVVVEINKSGTRLGRPTGATRPCAVGKDS